MKMDLDEVTALSARIAREHDSRLEVVAVTSTEGDSDRVELLITIAGCHRAPCVLMLNVSRTEPQQFEVELNAALHEALAGHMSET